MARHPRSEAVTAEGPAAKTGRPAGKNYRE